MKKKRFAAGLCYDKYLLFFVIGSLFGSFFEEIQWFIQKSKWTCRHDLLIGPFSTLYGFGVVMFLLILGPKNHQRNVFKTFFICFFLGGLFEYIAGFLAEKILSIKFWNYSQLFLNIQGRTTIPIMVIWGLFGCILLKIIYPFFSHWIEKIPFTLGKIVSFLLTLFFLFDMLFSYSVFARMVARHKSIPPRNKIEQYYDYKFNDAFMYKKYPILKGE